MIARLLSGWSRPTFATMNAGIGSTRRFRLAPETLRMIDRIQDRIDRAATVGGRVLVFLVIVVAGGIGTSWYLTTEPSRLTADQNGVWVAWTAAGRPDEDPYTRVRFARQGSLPLNAAAVLSYEARIDAEGRRLQSSCEYVIEGPEPPATWWSLSVYDDRGRLIPNPADRYAFNATNIARDPDGRVAITLARDARPGNWLPVGAGGRLTLILTLHGQISETAIDGQATRRIQLPVIRRLQCA